MKLYSPCGKCTVICHASQIENMKKSGWTEEKPKKINKAKASTEGEK